MQKPVNLRPETWKFLLESLPAGEKAGLPAAPANPSADPGPWLLEAGIMGRADLLRETVVADAEGVEYVIGQATAESVARGEALVSLRRLYDWLPVAVGRNRLAKMIASGGVFDQLTPKVQPRQPGGS